MAESAFEFRVMDPEQRKKGGALDLAYWAYKVRARTSLQQYAKKEMEVVRRYSDFEWLRGQLSDEYVFSIIPPIPEKDMTGTIEKFVGGAHDPRLLEYRQRALRKFLIRVGAHPHLYNSQLLQDFLEMDENEWERRMKSPKKLNPDRSIASAIGEAGHALLARQWYPGGGSQAAVPSGGSYSKAMIDNKSSRQVWDETRAYVGQLEASITVLRERLEQLVKRRRDTSAALHEFGRAFSHVGEIEGSIEKTSLSSALVAVGGHSEQLSTIYLEHADQETKKVVETLNYYTGMCTSVKEALKRLITMMAARDHLVSQVDDLASQREKAITKGGQPEKVAKIENEMIAMKEKRDRMLKQLADVEILFKEELRRFHCEKQYDIKSILKIFTELQLDYAAKMKRSWENLLPTVESAKVGN